MVDNLCGPSRVNNMLSTLNLKTILDTNLKIMEQPAGEVIEQVPTESAKIAASDDILNEMTCGSSKKVAPIFEGSELPQKALSMSKELIIEGSELPQEGVALIMYHSSSVTLGAELLSKPYKRHTHVHGLSYGKTHHVKKSLQLFKKGMSCFAINTKLGTGRLIFNEAMAFKWCLSSESAHGLDAHPYS
ncbi:hypothetical protein DPMN_013417 [Dreissena polymorpha]|uniref:Uncharacterized protein n=1 Tax=Dreissena polymorpha TaxID=45954 RepID=A0A9D4S3R9_DREPO|nr:hypothetical protein DPMN_013417 [Dreissena polymorpha]